MLTRFVLSLVGALALGVRPPIHHHPPHPMMPASRLSGHGPSAALLLLLAAGMTSTAHAQALPPAPAYTIERSSGSINVDGVLNEADWARAKRIPLSWETTPGDNVPALVDTECRMLYDTVTLYFGCVASDPEPDQIRAHLAERDDRARTIQDDHIVFLLDPFNDERRGFEFRVNSLGVQMDAILSRAEGIEDFSWNAVWHSEVRRTDSGYVVEVGIPFSSLRFPRTTGVQTWGLIIDRSYPRSVRRRMRSAPLDRNTTCLLCHANKITGFMGIEPGSAVEFVPTLTASRSQRREPFPTGDLVADPQTDLADIDPDIGLDVRWGVTTALSLNATLNPDFSQVEADVAQLAENRRFALFFPETRPFFLEGADFFLTPLQAVFTRSVVDPDAGVKLTGKEGANAVGFFAARDASTNFIFPSNQGSAATVLGQEAYNGVARFRRDVGPASNVGVLFTGRYGTDYQNQVVGADAFHRLTPSNAVRLQLLRSSTDYPDQLANDFGQPTTAFGDWALSAAFDHFSRDWVASVSFQDLGSDFRADAGFIPRVDTRILDGSVGRVFTGTADDWYTRIQTTALYQRTEDHQGTLTDQRFGAEFRYQGPSQSTVVVSPTRRKLLFRGVTHDLNRLEGNFEVRPSGSVTFGSIFRTGDFVDFRNNRRSFGLVLTPTTSFYLGSQLATTLALTHQRLRYEGNPVFTANLVQIRTLYHFNVRSFVRAILQYRIIERVAAQYVDPVVPQSEQLFTQFLFSYKVTPQTAFFLGYTDGQEGTDTFGLTTRSRTLFLKLGYAIQR